MTIESSEPRKTRKELLSEWRHNEVLHAARRIFARLGYSSANVDDIAKEAGMAKGTIYLYFKSKEEVFAAVLSHDLERLTNQTIEGMSAAQTFDDRVKVFLDLRMAYVQNNRDFMKVYFNEFGVRGSPSTFIAQVKNKFLLQGIGFMRQCLEEAIARGEVRTVPVETAAFAIYDIARGFVERHLSGQGQLPPLEDLAFTHSLILNGLETREGLKR